MRRRRKDHRIAAYRTVSASSEAEAIAEATRQLLAPGNLREPMDGVARLNEFTGCWDAKVYVLSVENEERRMAREGASQPT